MGLHGSIIFVSVSYLAFNNVFKYTKQYSLLKYCRQAKDGRNYVMYEVIGQNNVAVPTHFFKVILSESLDSQFDLECYLMANKNVDANLPLQAFQVPLDVIERASGLLIFEKLPKSKLRSINGPNKFLTKFEQKFINKK